MIVFNSEADRILAKALLGDNYNIRKGDVVILKRINNMFHHPNSCYVYCVKTGRWFGRYKLKSFEEIRHLEETDNPTDFITEKEESQQLSLF